MSPERTPGGAASRAELAGRIADLVERCHQGRLRLIEDRHLRPAFRILAGWQARRLRWTHRDLLVSERFGPPARFFFSDLYGDRDYSPRDEDMERVFPVMVRVMPRGALESIGMGLEVHALTQELDYRMIEILTGELGVVDRLSAEKYAEAYRRGDNAADRRRQILAIGEVGRALERVVHRTMVYNAVRLARRPAHMAGFGALQDFIERGFVSFRHMGSAKEFLDTIERRELGIMDAILRGGPVEDWAAPETGGAGQAQAPS